MKIFDAQVTLMLLIIIIYMGFAICFRFADMDKIGYKYMPFGIGPRSCIGMRLALMAVKILMVHLLNSYRLLTAGTLVRKLADNVLTWCREIYLMHQQGNFFTYIFIYLSELSLTF